MPELVQSPRLSDEEDSKRTFDNRHDIPLNLSFADLTIEAEHIRKEREQSMFSQLY